MVSNGRQSLAKLLPVDYLVKFKQRVAAVVVLFKTSLPVKKSCWLQGQSLDDELNHPNLIVNGLILTNGQKIAQIYLIFRGIPIIDMAIKTVIALWLLRETTAWLD